eukprot:g11179.t1
MEKEMSNQRSVVGFDEAGLKTKMSFLQTCEMKDNSCNVVDLDVFADSETKDHEHDLKVKPTHSWSTAVEQAEVAHGDGDDERPQAQDQEAQADDRGDDNDDAPGGSPPADVSSLSPAPKKLRGMKDKKKNWMPLDICELDAKYNVEDLWALLFDNYQWLRQVQTSLGKTKKSIAEFKLAKCSGGEQHGRIRGGSAGGAAGAPATPTAAGRRRTTAKWKNGGPGKSASCYFESPLKTSPGARSSCAANSSVFSSPSKRILSDRASLLAGMMCSPGRDSGDAGEAETKRIVDRLYLGGRDPGCMNSKSNDQNVVQERQLVAEAADHHDVSTDAAQFQPHLEVVGDRPRQFSGFQVF